MKAELNERLTRVGPGTPMGDLLRRYWHPVGTVPDLDQQPVQKVRVMGEDLTLYRSAAGEYGLIGDPLPAPLRPRWNTASPTTAACAAPITAGCSTAPGNAWNSPTRTGRTRRRATRTRSGSRPIRSRSWAGWSSPISGPSRPRCCRAGTSWCATISTGWSRSTSCRATGFNAWTNAADPVHFEYLHAVLGNHTLAAQGRTAAMAEGRHVKIAFDVFEYGIMKRRLLEGEPEDSDDWTTGHPLLFPNILSIGGQRGNSQALQIRVPVDDTATIQFAYRTTVRPPGTAPAPTRSVHLELFDEDGRITPDTIPKQDMLAWVAQGPISDRTGEHLATSDEGVILYRKILVEQMDRVARGEDPMGVIRDRARNEPMIDIRREGSALTGFDPQYKNAFERFDEMADAPDGR